MATLLLRFLKKCGIPPGKPYLPHIRALPEAAAASTTINS
jgi:hypothetical protein